MNMFFRKYLLVFFSLALLMLAGGCRSKAVIPFPGGGGSAGDITVVLDGHVSKERKRVVEVSQEWIGTPYAYARAEKGVASDCSGMVMRVYEEAASRRLPRNSAKQADFCKKIKDKEVKPGDLVFFATGKDPKKVSHVGIMLDKDNFVHMSSSKGGCVSSIHTPYYTRTFLLFGRVPDFD